MCEPCSHVAKFACNKAYAWCGAATGAYNKHAVGMQTAEWDLRCTPRRLLKQRTLWHLQPSLAAEKADRQEMRGM